MNNPAIPQILAELEDSLANIKSARTQVNEVGEKSELMISSFNSVLKSINSIGDQIGVDEAYVKEKIDDQFKILENEFRLILEKLQSSVSSTNEKIELHKNDFTENLGKNLVGVKEEFNLFSKNNSNNLNELNADLNKQKSDFNRNLEHQFTDFKNILHSNAKNTETVIKESSENFISQKNNFINDLQGSIDNLLTEFQKISTDLQNKKEGLKIEIEKVGDEFKNGIVNVNQNLKSFEITLSESEKKIEQLNFDDAFKSIYKHIDVKQKQNFIVGGACTILIILVIFLLK